MSTTLFQVEFDVPVPDPVLKSTGGPECTVYWQDGGQSLTLEPSPPDEDEGMFVRLMSWREGVRRGDAAKHKQLSQMLGKRCRVTVEILD